MPHETRVAARDQLILDMSRAGRMYLANSGPIETGLAYTMVVQNPVDSDIKAIVPWFAAFSEVTGFLIATVQPSNINLLPATPVLELPFGEGQPFPKLAITGGISATLPTSQIGQVAFGIGPQQRQVFDEFPLFEVVPGGSLAFTIDPSGQARATITIQWWEDRLGA